jgi:hypothetical protein
MWYEIRANGRYIDEVYTERVKTNDEIKKEYQKLLKTENVKVRRILTK